MNKYEFVKQVIHPNPVNKIDIIQDICRDKDVLDLGCVRHDASFSFSDPNWLHKKIAAVASSVLGVDYMEKEVSKLRQQGFNIIFGDVTKPLNLDQKYDVIVAGDLIEHLTNFEAFFKNCKRLLKSNGVLVISTPNPFYFGGFHYTAFKHNYLINPEHTCWIDPLTLKQLVSRFDLELQNVYFLEHRWNLSGFICENSNNPYDILKGMWQNNSLKYRIIRKVVRSVFAPFHYLYRILVLQNSHLVKYSDYLAVLRLKTIE